MRQQVLQTKLQRPPPASDALPRARLLEYLNEGRQRPLTLISAPAGYGKSTLASQWAAACDTPCAWVSLDEGDSDLRVFLRYVLKAIRSIFPAVELGTEVLLEANQLPPVQVLTRYLLNDLHQINEPFLLLLEDYHRIRETFVHDLVAGLLEHPPQSMHLVLITRHDPPLQIAGMRGRGQVTEIRAADLRFTPAEAAGFLRKMLKAPVDEGTAALLDRKCEGWVTGLRLAGLYLRGQCDMKQRVQDLSGGSGYIAEYLFAEVLAKQRPEMAAFLVPTSILDRFCASLCEVVYSGCADHRKKRGVDTRQFIDWLVEANVFVTPLDDHGHWFRYHHLFRLFLENMLHKQRSAEQIAGLHRAVSGWFAANGLIEEAIRHALLGGDTKAAIRVVLDQRYDMMNAFRFHLLSHWLAMLPRQVLDEEPLLVTTRAFLALMTGQLKDFFTLMDQARRMLAAITSEGPAKKLLQSEVAAVQIVGAAIVGQAAECLSAGQMALDLLPRQALFIKGLVLGSMSAGHQMQERLDRGVALLNDALENSELPEEIRSQIMQYACMIHYMDTKSSELLRWGHESLQLTAKSQPIHTSGTIRYFMGAIHYLRNEIAEARSHLLGVLEHSAVTNPTYIIHASGLLAFAALAEGAPVEARKAIEFRAENHWKIQNANLPEIQKSFRVEIALRQGRIDEARRLSVGVNFNTIPLIWFLFIPQLTPIKLLLAEGSAKGLEAARARLEEMEAQMAGIHRNNVRIDILALLALVFHKQGKVPEALQALGAALDLAEPGGWLRNFVDLGAPMVDLLERLHRVRPESRHSRRVLDACRAKSRGISSSGLPGQGPGPTLTRRETELLSLLAEGLGNKEIAERLHVATETVKTHLQNIYGKLGARGRVDALRKARRLGLIPPD